MGIIKNSIYIVKVAASVSVMGFSLLVYASIAGMALYREGKNDFKN